MEDCGECCEGEAVFAPGFGYESVPSGFVAGPFLGNSLE